MQSLIVNENPLNLEKTTSSVLSVIVNQYIRKVYKKTFNFKSSEIKRFNARL